MLLWHALPMQDTPREGVQHDVEQRLELRGQRVGLALESADSCKQWSACLEASGSRCPLVLQGRCQRSLPLGRLAGAHVSIIQTDHGACDGVVLMYSLYHSDNAHCNMYVTHHTLC